MIRSPSSVFGRGSEAKAPPGAIAQQALQRRAAIGRDGDAGVDRESSSMLPVGHVRGGFSVQDAMPTARPPAHPPPAPEVAPAPAPWLRYRRRQVADTKVTGCRNEPAVASAAVLVPVFTERRTEARQEARRAQPYMRRCRSAAAQFALDPADENAQHPRRQRRVAAQRRSQALGAWTTPTAASAPVE